MPSFTTALLDIRHSEQRFSQLEELMSDMLDVSPTGSWLDNSEDAHCFDEELAAALASFFRSRSVVDLGCGAGRYVSSLRSAGVECDGYDGNPHTETVSGGLCKVLDLSASVDLGRRYDWVLSLEVGEHLPRQYEAVFLENIVRHCQEGVVLSWGVPGQGGKGHVNLRENRYIKRYFTSRGFVNDVAQENALRDMSAIVWFKSTLMVFRRDPAAANLAGAVAGGLEEEHQSTEGGMEREEGMSQGESGDALERLQRSLDDIHWLLLMQRIREIVAATVPVGAVILIVGGCDDELMLLPGRQTWHFPQSPDGAYDHHFFIRGSEAIAHLKSLRNKGAEYLLFPATEHWWLELYNDLRSYVDTECRPVFQARSTCMIFKMT